VTADDYRRFIILEQCLRSILKKHSIPLLIIHSSASDETARKRLVRRLAEGNDGSDGRWEIYLEEKPGNRHGNNSNDIGGHCELRKLRQGVGLIYENRWGK